MADVHVKLEVEEDEMVTVKEEWMAEVKEEPASPPLLRTDDVLVKEEEELALSLDAAPLELSDPLDISSRSLRKEFLWNELSAYQISPSGSKPLTLDLPQDMDLLDTTNIGLRDSNEIFDLETPQIYPLPLSTSMWSEDGPLDTSLNDTCDTCLRSFFSKTDFENHLDTCSETKPLCVEDASTCVQTSSDLAITFERAGKGGVAVPVYGSSGVLGDRGESECGETGTALEYGCNDRPESSGTRGGEEGLESFTCNYCPRSFKTLKSFASHVHEKHSHIKPHACKECGMIFYWPEDLERHKNTNHGRIPSKTHVGKFKGSYRYSSAKRFNTDVFKCDDCAEVVKGCDKFIAHKCDAAAKLNKFKCRKCPLRFSDGKKLTEHETVHEEHDQETQVELNQNANEGGRSSQVFVFKLKKTDEGQDTPPAITCQLRSVTESPGNS